MNRLATFAASATLAAVLLAPTVRAERKLFLFEDADGEPHPFALPREGDADGGAEMLRQICERIAENGYETVEYRITGDLDRRFTVGGFQAGRSYRNLERGTYAWGVYIEPVRFAGHSNSRVSHDGERLEVFNGIVVHADFASQFLRGLAENEATISRFREEGHALGAGGLELARAMGARTTAVQGNGTGNWAVKHFLGVEGDRALSAADRGRSRDEVVRTFTRRAHEIETSWYGETSSDQALDLLDEIEDAQVDDQASFAPSPFGQSRL